MEEETARGGRRGLPRGKRSEGLSCFDGWVAGGVKVAERIAGQRAGEKDEEIYMPRSASRMDCWWRPRLCLFLATCCGDGQYWWVAMCCGWQHTPTSLVIASKLTKDSRRTAPNETIRPLNHVHVFGPLVRATIDLHVFYSRACLLFPCFVIPVFCYPRMFVIPGFLFVAVLFVPGCFVGSRFIASPVLLVPVFCCPRFCFSPDCFVPGLFWSRLFLVPLCHPQSLR